jgi:hypothetical protein
VNLEQVQFPRPHRINPNRVCAVVVG